MHTGRKSADTAQAWAAGLLSCESRRGIARYLDSIPSPPSASFRVYLESHEVAGHVKAHGGKAEVSKLASLANAAEDKLRIFTPGAVAACTGCGATGEHAAFFGPRIARAGKAHRGRYGALQTAAYAALDTCRDQGRTFPRLGVDRLETPGNYLARQNACIGCRREKAAESARKRAAERKARASKGGAK